MLSVDVPGDESKVWCCKEQYCIGTWNIRAWIKLNWTRSNRRWQEWTLTFFESVNENGRGLGEFNSDDHYIYCCGQESHRRNGVSFIVNRRNAVFESEMQYLSPNDRMILVHFQVKPFNITVILTLCSGHKCWRSWSWPVIWLPTRHSRTNTKKKMSFSS